MSKRIIATVLFLVLPLTAQCLAQSDKSKPAVTSALMKAKIIKYQKRKVAVTIRLKSGGVYHYVPSNSGEVEHKVDQKIKLSGTIAAADEEYFYFNERWFLGRSGVLRIRYEDVDKVRMNLIPNALKTIGEVGLYCIVLLPTCACCM